MNKTTARTVVLVSMCMTLAFAGLVPAGAHTSPTLDTSEVWAACPPQAGATFACDNPYNPDLGPRVVDISMNHYSPNTDVHVFWLRGAEFDDRTTAHCEQAVQGALDGAYALGTVTTDGSGSATMSDVPLPPGNHGEDWVYGLNWVCGTTADGPTDSGEVADQSFTVYPTPF